MTPAMWLLILAAIASGGEAVIITPPTEGPFDFVVDDSSYSPPAGNGVNFTVAP